MVVEPVALCPRSYSEWHERSGLRWQFRSHRSAVSADAAAEELMLKFWMKEVAMLRMMMR